MSEIVLEQIDEYRYRIARDEAAGMRTDVRVYATAALMKQIQKDPRSSRQGMSPPSPASWGLALPCPTFTKATGSRLAEWPRPTSTKAWFLRWRGFRHQLRRTTTPHHSHAG